MSECLSCQGIERPEVNENTFGVKEWNARGLQGSKVTVDGEDVTNDCFFLHPGDDGYVFLYARGNDRRVVCQCLQEATAVVVYGKVEIVD